MLEKEGAKEIVAKVKEQLFEKDDDKNGHIDFITAMTNLRSHNYKLPEMEWISVKLKAGRIVPALATTTAAIAGLQVVEAVKILKNLKIEQYRNVFMNMSIPVVTMPEPGPAVKYAITPELKVSVWDQWNFHFTASKGNSLGELFKWIEEQFKIKPRDLMKGNKPIFLSILNKLEEFESRPLDELLDLESGESVYVTVICYLDDPKKSLENIPPVKISFDKQ